MVYLPDSPSSPAMSAAIPTTTNVAYELIRHGGGREGMFVSAPSAAFSASKPQPLPEPRGQLLPVPRGQPFPIPAAKEEEEGAYDNYSIPGDRLEND